MVVVMLAGDRTCSGPVASGVAGAIYRALSERALLRRGPRRQEENRPAEDRHHLSLLPVRSSAPRGCYRQIDDPADCSPPLCAGAPRRRVPTLDELFTDCLPAFGGAYLRRIYRSWTAPSAWDARSRWPFRGPSRFPASTRRG